MAKNRKRKPKTKEDEQKKEQRAYRKEIKDFFNTIGFISIPGINGTEFTYENRTSEIDSIYIYENIVLIVEDTVGKPGEHLLTKKIIFDKINENPMHFFDFLLTNSKFPFLKKYWDEKNKGKYDLQQLQVKILYCSKKQIDDNQFVTDTFKGVTEMFVLKIINENKLNKYYHLNHPNFCDKFYYLMED